MNLIFCGKRIGIPDVDVNAYPRVEQYIRRYFGETYSRLRDSDPCDRCFWYACITCAECNLRICDNCKSSINPGVCGFCLLDTKDCITCVRVNYIFGYGLSSSDEFIWNCDWWTDINIGDIKNAINYNEIREIQARRGLKPVKIRFGMYAPGGNKLTEIFMAFEIINFHKSKSDHVCFYCLCNPGECSLIDFPVKCSYAREKIINYSEFIQYNHKNYVCSDCKKLINQSIDLSGRKFI